MRLKNICKVFSVVAALTLVGCGGQKAAESKAPETTTAPESTTAAETKAEETTKAESTGDASAINVFAAASLKSAMEEIITEYNKANPDVKIALNTDSSGKLQTQIEEGFACDIFFSAGKKQMEKLKEGGFIKEGTDVDLLHNKLCQYKGCQVNINR